MSRRLPAGNGAVGHDERDDPGRVLCGGALVGGRLHQARRGHQQQDQAHRVHGLRLPQHR